MVFRWAVFCTPLRKGYVLQKRVLLYTKPYYGVQFCTIFTVNIAFLSAIQVIVSPVLVSGGAI